MSKQLPTQSSVRQLKGQAKDLRKAYEARDGAALTRFRDGHPRHLGATDDELVAARLSLHDAQLLIAREYGFDSWPKLVETRTSYSELDAHCRLGSSEVGVRLIGSEMSPHSSACCVSPNVCTGSSSSKAVTR